MIKYEDEIPELKSFVGTVRKIEELESVNFLAQWSYHIEIEPENEKWNMFHAYIPQSSNTNRTVKKSTALFDFLQCLEEIGITGKTVKQTLKKMVKRKFRFEKRILGRCKRDTWVPVEVIE